MTRWFLSLAVLLGGTVGMTSADYIVIIANVGQSKPPPGGPGGAPFPGGSAGPGGSGSPMPASSSSPMPASSGSPMPAGSGVPSPGGSGNPTGVAGQPGSLEGKPVKVMAVVEVNAAYKDLEKHLKTPIDLTVYPGASPLDTLAPRFGMARLMNIANPLPGPEVSVQALETPTVAKRYDAKFAEVFKDKSGQKPTPEKIRDLADYAVTHDLNDKFVEVMKKMAEDNPNDKAVVAFLKVQADLDRPVAGDPSAVWKARLGEAYHDATPKDGKGHYVLFHNLAAADQDEVQERLARLEDSLRTFYYWFALQGVALPVPTERLPALLSAKEPEFKRNHDSLSDPPVVAAGFFARRENLSVFCDEPLDPLYEKLSLATDRFWTQGFNRYLLLSGKENAGYPKGTMKAAVSYYSTLALLMRALEDESERTAVSHDASRQLLFTAGLLPRGVKVPEWVQFGMGGFFETPLHSPWPTPAGPSTYYLPAYRAELGDKGNKFEGDPYKTLQKIVTDGYFRDLTPDDYKKHSERLMKARTATWSLTYFLAEKKLDNLQRYFQLLGEMPRDLDLDDAVLWTCFARAFDAYDAKTKKVDDSRLQTLADQWRDYMMSVPLESPELVSELQKVYTEISDKDDAPPPPKP